VKTFSKLAVLGLLLGVAASLATPAYAGEFSYNLRVVNHTQNEISVFYTTQRVPTPVFLYDVAAYGWKQKNEYVEGQGVPVQFIICRSHAPAKTGYSSGDVRYNPNMGAFLYHANRKP
jgi:hypothetical protein